MPPRRACTRRLTADLNSYLRATASYTDEEGSDKSAMERSEYSVERRPGSNMAPKFADDQDPLTPNDQDTAMRSVPENTPAGMAIGDPVVATDDRRRHTDLHADGRLKPTSHPLTSTGPRARSSPRTRIWTTTAGEWCRPATAVMVRGDGPVGVYPRQIEAVRRHKQRRGHGDHHRHRRERSAGCDRRRCSDVPRGRLATHSHDACITYTEDRSGDDDGADYLVGYGSRRRQVRTSAAEWQHLTFKAKPDFEAQGDANGDNVYEVTVVAADSNGNRGTRDVKVTVENEDEPGAVTLSRTQPRVGLSVKASLTDPDGSISGLTWQWSKGVHHWRRHRRRKLRHLHAG